LTLTDLRSSRATAVALVTFATFTDLIAYSVAVPVLPDLSRRLGASPTMIGFLFASFGVTLLTVSLPMGAISDRIGRKAPMVGGLVALAAATLLFAFATSLPWLFAARLVQGAADAVTWVVGFALIADRYGVDERGRVTGIVMSGTSFAFMIGPSIGGWLYELGGISLPFFAVAAAAALDGLAFLFLRLPEPARGEGRVAILSVLRVPEVAACAAAVVASASTLAMLEPTLPMFLSSRLGLDPAGIGLLFAIAAIASVVLPPIYGRLADRWGGRRLTYLGLLLTAAVLPLLSLIWSSGSAAGLMLLTWTMAGLMVTPSLAYMAEAVLGAGVEAYGVAYGAYNVAWACGLLAGPAIGGFLFERVGFGGLVLIWAPVLLALTILRAAPRRRPHPSLHP
jgi:multidrug resistance protein